MSFSGQSYDKADVEKMLKKVVKAHNALTERSATMKDTYAELKEAADTLMEREEQVKDKIAALEAQREKVVAKVTAMEGQKLAAQALSDKELSVADKAADIEKKLNDLDTNVTVQKTREDEKWKSSPAAKSDLADVNKIIDGAKSDKELLNEVDAILNGKK